MKRIIIGTTTRSGSTMLFHAVKNLYYFFTDYKIWSGWISSYKEKQEYIDENYEIVIVKTHYVNEQPILETDLVLAIERDVEQAAHSRKRVMPQTTIEDNKEFIIDLRDQWRQVATHIFQYKDYIENNKGEFAKKLMEILGIENKSIDINDFIKKNIDFSFLIPNNKFVKFYNHNGSKIEVIYDKNIIKKNWRRYK